MHCMAFFGITSSSEKFDARWQLSSWDPRLHEDILEMVSEGLHQMKCSLWRG